MTPVGFAAEPVPGAPSTGPRGPRPRALSDSDLVAESALIEAARAALARSHPRTVLDHVARHESAFRRGRLIEEREALRISALARLGRLDEAVQRAERFRRRYPESIALQAIEQALASARVKGVPPEGLQPREPGP